MVINLEFIRAIVTAEEVLLLDPLMQEVLPFVDQLRQHLPLRNLVGGNGEHGGDGNGVKQDGSPGDQVPCLNEATGAEHELPFEFQVLEVGLEAVCSTLDSSVADLERRAIPVLDELTKNVSTKNLERVRSLKSDLTRLLARVQKVSLENLCCLSPLSSRQLMYNYYKTILVQVFKEPIATIYLLYRLLKDEHFKF